VVVAEVWGVPMRTWRISLVTCGAGHPGHLHLNAHRL
jgi:hypothetical protein